MLNKKQIHVMFMDQNGYNIQRNIENKEEVHIRFKEHTSKYSSQKQCVCIKMFGMHKEILKIYKKML